MSEHVFSPRKGSTSPAQTWRTSAILSGHALKDALLRKQLYGCLLYFMLPALLFFCSIMIQWFFLPAVRRKRAAMVVLFLPFSTPFLYLTMPSSWSYIFRSLSPVSASFTQHSCYKWERLSLTRRKNRLLDIETSKQSPFQLISPQDPLPVGCAGNCMLSPPNSYLSSKLEGRWRG